MCGILWAIAKKEARLDEDSTVSLLRQFNKQRGPDLHGCESVTHGSLQLLFEGNVLHLRGPTPTRQPIVCSNGDLLCWNGEIYGGGVPVPPGENDGIHLMAQLSQAKGDDDVLQILASIHGEWALVFFHRRQQKVWFGRDFLGRRSLMWRWPSDRGDSLLVSSVGCQEPVGELELQDDEEGGEGEESSSVEAKGPLIGGWQEVPAKGIYSLDIELLASRDNPMERLEDALVWHARKAEGPLTFPFPKITADLPTDADLTNSYYITNELVDNFLEVFGAAVQSRVTALPTREPDSDPETSRLGILFSGGIDSMMMAAFADKYLPEGEPVDLFNVAFANTEAKDAPGSSSKPQKRGKAVSETSPSSPFNVPDRQTGIAGLEELRAISPNRKWRFVEINIPSSQLPGIQKRVCMLMNPAKTVLDLSIATALWCASRGRGLLHGQEYVSPVRVLLVGIGADEQLAGYSRHRVRFDSGGWESLIQEMQLELDRISQRNLGRDDRCIGDHGKEARFPFLDENLVSFLSKLPIWCKTDMRKPRGEGEKLLLRIAARKIGLTKSTSLPKRAIQFGSRIAKLKDRKEKGNDLVE